MPEVVSPRPALASRGLHRWPRGRRAGGRAPKAAVSPPPPTGWAVAEKVLPLLFTNMLAFTRF